MPDTTRTKSMRIPLSDAEFQLMHKLAHAREQALTIMMRALITEECARRKVTLPREKKR